VTFRGSGIAGAFERAELGLAQDARHQQLAEWRALAVPNLAAAADLRRMMATHSLPTDTRARVRRSIEPLARFPLLGAPLEGRWHGYRFVLGPWRWMPIVYAHDPETNTVAIVTIQDGRTSDAATARE
jgi:plasmid stabilization system protein ParE